MDAPDINPDADFNDRISVDPDVRFGRSVIAGTRVAVEEVVGLIAAGWDQARVAEEFEITTEDVAAALGYAAKSVANERRWAQ